MNWLSIPRKGGGIESRAIRSDCGRYQIARITINGVDRYELWRRFPTEMLSHYSTADKAKTAAEILGRKAA